MLAHNFIKKKQRKKPMKYVQPCPDPVLAVSQPCAKPLTSYLVNDTLRGLYDTYMMRHADTLAIRRFPHMFHRTCGNATHKAFPSHVSLVLCLLYVERPILLFIMNIACDPKSQESAYMDN